MKNKVVLITGGTSGIGLALAKEFGRLGSLVALTGRNSDRLAQTEKDLHVMGITCFCIQADVTSEVDQRKAVAQTVNRFGRLDVLICNAGISMRALFQELDLTVIRRVMETNFFGAVGIAHAALPYLIRSKGSLVGISSIAGYKGLPGRTGYSASKFALGGFLEALRLEMRTKGVHVLLASPGFTATEIRMHSLTKSGAPQGESPRAEEEMMSAEAVAAQIYTAVLHRKRELLMTKEGKLLVWLNKFFPAWADRLVYKAMQKEEGSGLEPIS